MSVVKKAGLAAVLATTALGSEQESCVIMESKQSYNLAGVSGFPNGDAQCMYVPRTHNGNGYESHLKPTIEFVARIDAETNVKSKSSSSSSSGSSDSSDEQERQPCHLVVKPNKFAKGSFIGQDCHEACPQNSNEMCWCFPMNTQQGKNQVIGKFVTDEIYGGKYWMDMACKATMTQLSMFDGQINGADKQLKLENTALSGSKVTTGEDGTVTGLQPSLLGGKYSIHLLMHNTKQAFEDKQDGRRLLDPEEVYVVELDVDFVEGQDDKEQETMTDEEMADQELKQEMESIFEFVNEMVISMTQSFFEPNMQSNDLSDSPLPLPPLVEDAEKVSEADVLEPAEKVPPMVEYPSSHPQILDTFLLANKYAIDSQHQYPIQAIKLKGGVRLAMKTQGKGDVLFALTPINHDDQHLFSDNQLVTCRVKPGQSECHVVIPLETDFAVDITNYGSEIDSVSMQSLQYVPDLRARQHQSIQGQDQGKNKSGAQTWVKVMLLSAVSVIFVALFGFSLARLRNKRRYQKLHEPVGLSVQLPTLDNYEVMNEEESITDVVV